MKVQTFFLDLIFSRDDASEMQADNSTHSEARSQCTIILVKKKQKTVFFWKLLPDVSLNTNMRFQLLKVHVMKKSFEEFPHNSS